MQETRGPDRSAGGGEERVVVDSEIRGEGEAVADAPDDFAGGGVEGDEGGIAACDQEQATGATQFEGGGSRRGVAPTNVPRDEVDGGDRTIVFSEGE
jgi:hypothetical protein